MASKEVYIPKERIPQEQIPQEKKGVVGKGLTLWQRVNGVTMFGGATVGAVGLATGIVPLAVLGFGSAAVDAGQTLVIDKIQSARRKRAEKEAIQEQVPAEMRPREVTIFDRIKYAKDKLFPSGTIYQRQPQPQAA